MEVAAVWRRGDGRGRGGGKGDIGIKCLKRDISLWKRNFAFVTPCVCVCVCVCWGDEGEGRKGGVCDVTQALHRPP